MLAEWLMATQDCSPLPEKPKRSQQVMCPLSVHLAGTEALFADMGHFNRQSIQASTLFLVYPALMITYLGQVGCLHHRSLSQDT